MFPVHVNAHNWANMLELVYILARRINMAWQSQVGEDRYSMRNIDRAVAKYRRNGYEKSHKALERRLNDMINYINRCVYGDQPLY